MPDNPNLGARLTGVPKWTSTFHSLLFTLHSILIAVILVLVLSGCASMPGKKDSSAPLAPPKPMPSFRELPLPEAGPPPASLAPTGSLWAPDSKSLVADVKACKIGDIVTITVS